MSYVEFRHGGLQHRLSDKLVCYVGVTLPELGPVPATLVLRGALASPLATLATQIRGRFSDIDGGRAGAPVLRPDALADRIGMMIRQQRMMLVAYEPVSAAMLVKSISEAPARAGGDPTLVQRVKRVVLGMDDVPMAAIGEGLRADFETFRTQMTESPALVITMVAVVAGWAASQAAPPVGLAIDAVLFGFAVYALGSQAFDWVERLAKLVGRINAAKTDADFAACSLELVRLILMIGISVFITLLLRAAGKKIGKSAAQGEPDLKTVAPSARPGASAGAGTNALATNPPIKATPKGLKHTLDRHTDSGIAKFSGKSKFSAGEDVEALIQRTTHSPMTQQPNGNFTRTVDMGRAIGIDRGTGQTTRIMTVVTKPNGDLVTAFPGKP